MSGGGPHIAGKEANYEKAMKDGQAENAIVTPLTVAKDLLDGRGPPLRVLLLATVIEFAGFAMIIPILPFFLIHELGLDASSVGFLLSCFSLAQLVGSWMSGRISDAIGRRLVIIVIFTWAGLGFAATAYVTTFLEIAVVRVTQGFSGGTAALCDAYVLDTTSEHNRAAYVGLLNSMKALAFLLGPGISVFLLHIGITRRTIFLVAGACGLLSGLLCYFFLEESLPESKRRPLVTPRGGHSKEGCDSSEFDAVNKSLLCVWTVRVFTAMGLGFLFATHAFLIKDAFGWGDAEYAGIILTASLLIACVQFAVFPSLSRNIGTSRVLLLGCLSGVVAFILFPEPLVVMHALAMLFQSFAFGFVEPSLPVIVGESVSDNYLGFANGGTASFRALAMILTPFFAGRLYEVSPYHAYYCGACCFTAAALAVIPILFVSEEEQALMSVAIAEGAPLAKKSSV